MAEADQKTHPSQRYALPYKRARDFAHAKELLNDFCRRMVAWGLANFGERSRERRLLVVLDSIKATLEQADTNNNNKWTDIFRETERTNDLNGTEDQMGLCGFSQKFEVDDSLYDIREVVELIGRHACRNMWVQPQ